MPWVEPHRHEPLISHELFNRVQEVLFTQRGAGTRARTHHHYLKGTVWCHRCHRRLMIMRGKSKSGALYFYFTCRGRQDHTCDLPYLPILDAETAIENHYATIALPQALRDRITTGMSVTLATNAVTSETLGKEIKKHLAKLDNQEDQYLDLVGDPDWPKEKIAKRLRTIRDERARLQAQLARTERPDLDAGRKALTTVLDLFTNPHELYRLASETQPGVLPPPLPRRPRRTPRNRRRADRPRRPAAPRTTQKRRCPSGHRRQ